MADETDVTESALRRYRNLKMFKGKTDEDIIGYLNSRPPKPIVENVPPKLPNHTLPTTPLGIYNKKFKDKLRSLQKEYSVDMNDANDADSLKALVRFMIQLEVVDESIRDFYQSKSTNTKILKDLGDYQRGLQMSISDLQQRLGITRQSRQEKSLDDVPQFLKELKQKAEEVWKRKTIPIRCEKDQIELARFWLNFPTLENEASFELTCWKCRSKVIFNI